SWSTPSCNGGTPITDYYVYRNTAGAPFTPPIHASVSGSPPPTSFVDSGTNAASTYHYVVSAANLVGEGPQSGEAVMQGTGPTGTLPQCMDGFDNDGDGLVDWQPSIPGGGDPGCTNAFDTSET
ncbi:MAG: fibronectin type III domain-containing protein, partial [Halobacteriales archaeon]|nr:fibronectin type III domain-containing protein [Halobacteriales archaeon]